MQKREKEFIAKSISKIAEDFVRNPNKYLTEDDVRIHLCKILSDKFGEIETTNDGDESISLHAEVRWYGKGTLKYRSDIVLIDVATLGVKKTFEMPSKGYSFVIPKAIIELKFRRPNGESDKAFIMSVKQDLNKVTNIKSEFASISNNNILSWVIAFDKKRDIGNSFNNDDRTLIYKFSNVADMNRANRL